MGRCVRGRLVARWGAGLLVVAATASGQGTVPGGRPVRPPAVRRVPTEHATIQAAIDVARDGDVVLVARGTYTGSVDFRGKAIEVVAWEGPAVTILSGSGGDSVVRFHSGEGRSSRLIGFTVRGGVTGPASSAGGVSGADPSTGLAARASLLDCIIEDNRSNPSFLGFGPAGVSGDLLLEGCILRRNHSVSAPNPGGAEGSLTLFQCVVEENTGCGGGGLRLGSGSHVLDCLLRGNRAGPCETREGPYETSGGGIFVAGPGVVVEGSILVDNLVSESPEFGGLGGCFHQSVGGAVHGDALLERCTVVRNGWESCGLIGGLAGNPVLSNSIVYENADPPGHYLGQAGFRYSDVEGGAVGGGSFDAYPVLIERDAGDLRLGPGSPCLDRGDPSSPLDPDGTRADLGARYAPQGSSIEGVAWHERASLVPSDPALADGFGGAVAASGDTLLVGATAGEFTPGSVSVRRRQAGEWIETQRLESGELYDAFGTTLDVEGDRAVVGAISAEAGPTVHVFERSSPASPFALTASLSESTYHYASSVALSGDFLAVGADVDGLGAGSVYLYRRLGRGTWRLAARFRAPETQGWLASDYGSALDLDGDTLVVGAPVFGEETYRGQAYVYQRVGTSPHSWTLVRTLEASDRLDGGRFGQTVAIRGDTLLVGSTTGVYAFARRGPGLPWSEVQKLVPSGGVPGPRGGLVLEGDRAWFTRSPAVLSEASLLWEFTRSNPGAPWFEAARVAFPREGLRSLTASVIAFTEGTLFLGPGETAAGPEVRRLTRGPEVHTVGLDQAADEETVTLTGRGLAAVTRVLLDGAEAPLVARDEGMLRLRPAPRAPGFATLTLESPEGDLVLPGAWRAAPALRASSDGSGGRLEVELENGAPGVFALFWSFDLRQRPLTLSSPPTWHALELGLLPARSGSLTLSSFSGSGRAVRAFDLPSDPALVGVPFYLQAWCQRGLLPPLRYSFSNTAGAAF